MTPLDSVLGKAGEDPQCKVFSAELAVHWYRTDAVPGDACICGLTELQQREADQ